MYEKKYIAQQYTLLSNGILYTQKHDPIVD